MMCCIRLALVLKLQIILMKSMYYCHVVVICVTDGRVKIEAHVEAKSEENCYIYRYCTDTTPTGIKAFTGNVANGSSLLEID